MNPWLSIWLQPRQTIRQIVDTNPTHLVLVLAMAGGVANVLMQATGQLSELEIPFMVAAVPAAGIGAVLGLIGLYIFGWLYRWVGGWLGGQATNVQVRAAIAWGNLPGLYLFGLWVVLMLVTGGTWGIGSVLLFALPAMVVGVWAFVIMCKLIGEVHRFSAWKGLGTILIPQVILVVPVAILALLAAIAIPNILRARTAANESAVIGNLMALASSLEMHRTVKDGYPDDWQADMYSRPRSEGLPPFGPPSFDADFQASGQTVVGYTYRYSPVPAGCVEPNCRRYEMTAIPVELQRTGTRSFFLDESGVPRHCTGDGGAGAGDPTFHEPTVPC